MLPPASTRRREIFAVPNLNVYEFRSSVSVEAAVPPSRFFASDNVVSICDSPSFSRDTHTEQPESNPDGLGCARGLRTAFLFEGCMVMLAYGIWHFWHLAH